MAVVNVNGQFITIPDNTPGFTPQTGNQGTPASFVPFGGGAPTGTQFFQGGTLETAQAGAQPGVQDNPLLSQGSLLGGQGGFGGLGLGGGFGGFTPEQLAALMAQQGAQTGVQTGIPQGGGVQGGTLTPTQVTPDRQTIAPTQDPRAFQPPPGILETAVNPTVTAPAVTTPVVTDPTTQVLAPRQDPQAFLAPGADTAPVLGRKGLQDPDPDVTEPVVTEPVVTDPAVSTGLGQLFTEEFGRAIGPEGLAFYTQRLEDGASLEDIRRELSLSPEGIRFDAAETGLGPIFVDETGREIGAEGLAFWQGQLEAGMPLEQIRARIEQSPEGRTFDATQTGLGQVFLDELGRDIGPEGIAFYMQRLEDGATLEQLRLEIRNSPEGQAFAATQGGEIVQVDAEVPLGSEDIGPVQPGEEVVPDIVGGPDPIVSITPDPNVPVVTDPVVTDPVVTDPVVTDPVVTDPVIPTVDDGEIVQVDAEVPLGSEDIGPVQPGEVTPTPVAPDPFVPVVPGPEVTPVQPFQPSQPFDPGSEDPLRGTIGQAPIPIGLAGSEEALLATLEGIVSATDQGFGASQIQADIGQQRSDILAGQGVSALGGFADPGRSAANLQSALLGASGPEAERQAIADFIASPGQQFALERGREALLRTAAVTGNVGGGRLQQELQRQGIGFAQQAFNDRIAQLSGLTGQGLQAAGGQANLLGGQAGLAGALGQQLSQQGFAGGQAVGQGLLGLGSQAAAGRTRAAEVLGGQSSDTNQQIANLLAGQGAGLSDIIGQSGGNLANIMLSAGQQAGLDQTQLATMLANIATGSASQLATLPGIPGVQQGGGSLGQIGALLGGVGTVLGVPGAGAVLGPAAGVF